MIVDPDNSPIIIFGAPRSGTTYLGNILDPHSTVAITNEVRLMVWAHQSANILTQQEEMINNYRAEFTAYVRKKFPDLIRGFYRELRPQATYWGDKNSHYAAPEHRGCLEAIVSLFPGAHFIHIIRDGRDVVSSILRMSWTDFKGAHDYWKNEIDIGCAFGRSQPPDRYFELRYEVLGCDDAAVSENIFAFLGIAMHPTVAAFCQAQRIKRTAAGYATRDLSAGVTNSVWAELLTSEEQLCSLELFGEDLIRHGYESPKSLEVKRRAVSGSADSKQS